MEPAASSTASGASSRIGVRSPPPPNQPLGGDQHPRIEMRGRNARALHMRDQRDAARPETRILSHPGSGARNSGVNSPHTVETFTPTFSKTRPRIRLITPPPPAVPSGVGRATRCMRTGPPAAQRGGRLRVFDRLEGRAEPGSRRLSNQAWAASRSAPCGGSMRSILALPMLPCISRALPCRELGMLPAMPTRHGGAGPDPVRG